MGGAGKLQDYGDTERLENQEKKSNLTCGEVVKVNQGTRCIQNAPP